MPGRAQFANASFSDFAYIAGPGINPHHVGAVVQLNQFFEFQISNCTLVRQTFHKDAESEEFLGVRVPEVDVFFCT